MMTIDQTGRQFEINALPRRIVSLVPSQTELLHWLGLHEEVAGITKFCVHPAEWFHAKTRVGGTKQLDKEAIYRIGPDLVIANKEENVKEQVEEIARQYPVWISDVNNLEEAYQMIREVGRLTGKEDKAIDLNRQIRQRFARLQPAPRRPRTAYLIWRKPYMTAGGDTFIHALLSLAGFDNIFAAKTRYPETTLEELATVNCELLLLSSEPFPFTQKHIAEMEHVLPHTKIMLVDGEMFSWYGSRLLHAASYFEKLILNVG